MITVLSLANIHHHIQLSIFFMWWELSRTILSQIIHCSIFNYCYHTVHKMHNFKHNPEPFMIWLLLTSLTLSQTTLPFISSSAILVCIWFLKAFLFSRPLCLLLPKYQILVFFSPFRSQFKYHFYERLS